MTTYTVTTEANERLYRPLPETHPESGYLVFRDYDGSWMWLYQEPNEDDEIGSRFAHRDEVLDDIASDWEHSGGERLPRFVSMLRGQATRARFERLRSDAGSK